MREQLRLSNREIVFEEFQPMWSQSTNVIEGKTDGRTDDLLQEHRTLYSIVR